MRSTCATPASRRSRWRCARARHGVKKAEGEKFKVIEVAEAAKWADVMMMLTPDELQGDIYRDHLARQHEGRRGADVRPRPQRAFQPDRAARRSRRADDRAQGPRPHRALGISARRRRAVPRRDPPGRLRQRPRSRPLLCLGDRRRPRRHHRDDVQGGVRDRSVRRAVGAVRRPGRADEGRLRDAGARPATRRRWPISSASTR